MKKANKLFNEEFGRAQYSKIWAWRDHDSNWFEVGYNENGVSFHAWLYAENAWKAKELAALGWLNID